MKFWVRLRLGVGDTGASSREVARMLYPREVAMIVERLLQESRIPVRFEDIHAMLKPGRVR